MLEILFSDSACGSLKAAQSFGKGKYIGGCVSVVVTRDDGKKVKKSEKKAAQRAADKEMRQEWENAVPMQGSENDIFSLSLNLSVGDISENLPSDMRLKALQQAFSVYPDCEGVGEKQLEAILESLELVRQGAQAGEELRIWYSNQPDEMCGFYWFMAQLKQWDIKPLNVSVIKLPEWEQDGDTIVRKTGWGEVSPGQWHRYLSLRQQVTESFVSSCALYWHQLQEENAPLRTLLCGRLVSAPKSIYDDFILREIEIEDKEFSQVKIIGRVLGKYQLGISDWLIAQRMEEMIKSGSLIVVKQASEDNPSYHRTLRKA